MVCSADIVQDLHYSGHDFRDSVDFGKDFVDLGRSMVCSVAFVQDLHYFGQGFRNSIDFGKDFNGFGEGNLRQVGTKIEPKIYLNFKTPKSSKLL